MNNFEVKITYIDGNDAIINRVRKYNDVLKLSDIPSVKDSMINSMLNEAIQLVINCQHLKRFVNSPSFGSEFEDYVNENGRELNIKDLKGAIE